MTCNININISAPVSLLCAGVAVEKLEEAAAASGKAADSKAVERSPTTLLVKNLPYSVTVQELQVEYFQNNSMGKASNHQWLIFIVLCFLHVYCHQDWLSSWSRPHAHPTC